MPQPMAASTIRKQSAAMAMPTTLPPTRPSASDSPPPAVWTRGPLDREYRPIANIAGSPAPARRPKTMIFQSAERLIQDIVRFPCRSGCRGLGFGRSGRSGPFVVDVAGIDLAAAGPPVDEACDREQDQEVDDHADGAADPVRQAVGPGPDQRRRRQREDPGGGHPP